MIFQGEHLLVLLDTLKANRAFCEFCFDEMFASLKPEDDAITLLELLSCSVSDEFEGKSDVPDPKCAKDLIQGIIDSVIKSEWE